MNYPSEEEDNFIQNDIVLSTSAAPNPSRESNSSRHQTGKDFNYEYALFIIFIAQ